VKGRCPRPLDDGDPDDGVNRQLLLPRLASLLLVIGIGKLRHGYAKKQGDESVWYQCEPETRVLIAMQHFPKPNNHPNNAQYQPQQGGDDAKFVHRTSC
jgi:hypothetical protein